MKCSSELSSSILNVVLPFQQLRLCSSLGFGHYPDGCKKVICLHFDITITLLLWFLLGSHTQSLITESDCCGFCQMTRNRAAVIVVSPFSAWECSHSQFPKVNPKHLSSETPTVLWKWRADGNFSTFQRPKWVTEILHILFLL